MFIKKTKVSDTVYIQVTKSFRKGKKVRHKVIINLGRLDKINKKDVDGLIAALEKLRAEFFTAREGEKDI